MKFWLTEYYAEMPGKDQDDAQRNNQLPKQINEQISALILTFRIGQLTPEECFFIINNVLNASDNISVDGTQIPATGNEEQPYTSVLLSDTAELCSGFPLLASDPLFLPGLVDLFMEKKLVTVCIGVDTRLRVKTRISLFL